MSVKENGNQLHKNHRNRLRKKFEKYGIEGLEDHEIIELMLFYSIPRKDVNEIAHNLLRDNGNHISSLFEADIKTLMKTKGIGYNSAILIKLILGLFKSYSIDKADKSKNVILDTTSKTGEYVKNLFIGDQKEVFYLIALNKKLKVIQAIRLFEGTVDSVPMYKRELVEKALEVKATTVILAHNHPSGNPMPSGMDILSTEDVAKALKTVDIEIADHIIVAGDIYSSFKEIGIKIAL